MSPNHIFFSLLKQRLSKYPIMKHSDYVLFIFMMMIAIVSIQGAPIENIANNKRASVLLRSENQNVDNDLIKRNDQEDMKEFSFDKRNGQVRDEGGSSTGNGNGSSSSSDPPGGSQCGKRCKRNEVKQKETAKFVKRMIISMP